MRGFVPPSGKDEALVQRRVADMAKAVRQGTGSKFLGFYSLREQELATAALHRLQWQDYEWYGGFEGAERCMLCVFENMREVEFPIVHARITVQGGKNLTHRDYLGAMLGTGIQRENVGDILVNAEGAVAMVHARIFDHLQDELREVGRGSARVTLAEQADMPEPLGERPVKSASVASLRLDAVLAAMLPMSRTDAVQLIRGGRVQVNHLTVESPHYEVQAGDVFSLRGIGKYELKDVGGKSRKNRTWIEYIQY